MTGKMNRTQKGVIFLISLTAFLVWTGAMISAWWLWGPITEKVVPTRLKDHSARFENGDIIVTRYVRVEEPVKMNITRDLYIVNGRTKSGVALPKFEVYVNRRNGDDPIHRVIDVPYKLQPGTYQLASVIEWRANPIRTINTPLPVVKFEVKE